MRTSNCCPVGMLISTVRVKQIELTVWVRHLQVSFFSFFLPPPSTIKGHLESVILHVHSQTCPRNALLVILLPYSAPIHRALVQRRIGQFFTILEKKNAARLAPYRCTVRQMSRGFSVFWKHLTWRYLHLQHFSVTCPLAVRGDCWRRTCCLALTTRMDT